MVSGFVSCKHFIKVPQNTAVNSPCGLCKRFKAKRAVTRLKEYQLRVKCK
jgi:hypothetical protein